MATTSSKKNLILGLAEDLSWEQLRPFIESLACTSFSGDVHLFVAGLEDAAMRSLSNAGVQLHRYRRLRLEVASRAYDAQHLPLSRLHSSRVTACYPRLLSVFGALSKDTLMAKARLGAAISTPNIGRFYRFYRLLSAVGGSYANVMVVDVRDVFFLADPFAFEIGNRVYSFLEYEGETLGSERQNRRWLLEALGEPVFERLAEQPICCVGATIGSSRAVLAYLELMVQGLSCRREFYGLDQAVHNALVHTGAIPNLELVSHGVGPVLHLALVPKGESLNELASGPPGIAVLHQYDRHPRLAELLLRRLDSEQGCEGRALRRQ